MLHSYATSPLTHAYLPSTRLSPIEQQATLCSTTNNCQSALSLWTYLLPIASWFGFSSVRPQARTWLPQGSSLEGGTDAQTQGHHWHTWIWATAVHYIVTWVHWRQLPLLYYVVLCYAMFIHLYKGYRVPTNLPWARDGESCVRLEMNRAWPLLRLCGIWDIQEKWLMRC